jgi:hypothetical protein
MSLTEPISALQADLEPQGAMLTTKGPRIICVIPMSYITRYGCSTVCNSYRLSSTASATFISTISILC